MWIRQLFFGPLSSFHSSFCLSGHFLGIVSFVFSKFWHDARNPYEVVCDKAWFSRTNFSTPKIEKRPKTGPFEDIENFCHKFLLNLFCSEHVYYLLCSCTSAIFGKNILRYGPKCPQPIRLQDFFINHISRTNHWNSLIFACWYKFT